MGVLNPAHHDHIEELTKSLETELIEFRRTLHRFPELGREEHRTTAAIVQRLVEAGLSPKVLSTGTGVICDILDEAGTPPSVGLRGDIDALPLQDAKNVPYRSQVDGVCHACGHDAHTTVALGAALVLAELRTNGLLPHSVRVVFQPAEEATPGGALDVIDDGYIKGLDRIFAIHCDPKLEVGKVGLRSGPITAGADRVQVRMRGKGGHTARPHLTSDLVFALGAVVTQLPGVLSRLADPRASLSIVWGQVHAGRVANAIPQEGYVEGTMRCLDARVWESAHSAVPDLVRSIASPYGVDVEVDMHTSVPPCVNDAAATEWLREVAVETLGQDSVTTTDQSLGGEDFAWILNRVPGALVRLGVRGHQTAASADLHQGSFDIDESAIGVGVRLFATAAVSPAVQAHVS
jgi:amidohydrolase